MRRIAHILLLGGLLAAACTPERMQENAEKLPVLFSVGSEDPELTKASVPYMALGGHFVCTMYYHAAATASMQDEGDFDVDGGTATNAWLKVNNDRGNSVYWNEADESAAEVDSYGFDKRAPIFYWNNRMTHAFVALADYNHLDSYPARDVAYDLTRGTRTSMAEQPDPIRALTLSRPTGSLPEANRVRLYFRHQFAQVQVNLKPGDDNSAQLSADQIDKVELLGVSEEAYVPTQLKADGTLEAASAKPVRLDDYSDAQLKENKWGTSMPLFAMSESSVGYLKSFQAICFGRLAAIRITWHEEEGNHIVHSSTFEVPETNESHVGLWNLQSGMRYIYDLEIRRGTLAVIRAEIKPWQQKTDLVYGADGTITN